MCKTATVSPFTLTLSREVGAQRSFVLGTQSFFVQVPFTFRIAPRSICTTVKRILANDGRLQVVKLLTGQIGNRSSRIDWTLNGRAGKTWKRIDTRARKLVAV
jgi:hypothetical protein